jgi:hypothetical protein
MRRRTAFVIGVPLLEVSRAALGDRIVRAARVDTPYDRGPRRLQIGDAIVRVGLLAAIGPARRGLRIQPSEALREG